MSNGVDSMKVAAIEGLVAEIQFAINALLNTNPIQLEAKKEASEVLYHWEHKELTALKAAYQEVETS